MDVLGEYSVKMTKHHFKAITERYTVIPNFLGTLLVTDKIYKKETATVDINKKPFSCSLCSLFRCNHIDAVIYYLRQEKKEFEFD